MKARFGCLIPVLTGQHGFTITDGTASCNNGCDQVAMMCESYGGEP